MQRPTGMITRSQLAFCACTFMLTLASDYSQAETTSTTGVIETAIVFRNSARITRAVEVPASNPAVEIVVTQLPESLVDGSVVAETASGATIGRVRVTRSAVNDSSREEVDRLQQEYGELQRDLTAINHQLGVASENLKTLQSMVDFSATQAKQNLDRATLDVDSVTQLADFAVARRISLSGEHFKLESQAKDLTAKMAANQQRLLDLATAKDEVNYEARLLVQVHGDQPVIVRLRYDVTGCSWSPSYMVYGDSQTEKFRLLANADILQDSGEDWTNTQIVLSTSDPSLRSDAPRLSPLRVSSSSSDSIGSATYAGHANQFFEAVTQTAIGDTLLNQQAGLEQLKELTHSREIERRLAVDASLELIGGSFELPELLEIASQRERQTVRVFESQLSGEMTRLVTPLLSSYAYRQAKLENTLTRGLMVGPTDVFLDDQFVGQTEMPATAVGQPLSIGFGPDYQIRTRRELIERTEETRGGNQLVSVRYRIVINNLLDEVVACRVQDRLPITEQTSAVTIKMNATDEAALSDDSLYQRMQRPIGILRWDIAVPAKRFGSQAFDLEYEYQVELDRTLKLTSDDMLQQIQQDQSFQRFNGGGGMGGGFGGGMGGGGMGGGGAFAP